MMSDWGVKGLKAAGVDAMLSEPSADSVLGSDSIRSAPAASRPCSPEPDTKAPPIQCCSYACYLRAASAEKALVAGAAADGAKTASDPPLQQSNRLSKGVQKLAALEQ